MSTLTNEIHKLKLNRSAGKTYDKQARGKPLRCYECNKEGHIKRNCPKLKKRPYEGEHKDSREKRGLGRPVRSKQTSACPSGSIGVGSSLDEAGMYIDISVQGAQAKFLVDTGATLTLLSSAM